MKFDFLLAQPAKEPLTDPKEINKKYRFWRTRVLLWISIGYATYYVCRKNLSSATPALMADLGYTKTQVGSIWSGLYLSYGVSKFVNGVLADRANPKYFMGIGLIFCALTNLWFGLSSSLGLLIFVWALNGWFQGMGGPPGTRLITHWFSGSERGTKWAIWDCGRQIGSGSIVILCGLLSEHYSWRLSFYIPAGISLMIGLIVINRLTDTPESMGLPSVEVYRNDPLPSTQESQAHLTIREILFHQVFNKKQIWLLAFANFFLYIVRYSTFDWTPAYLVEARNAKISGAALIASCIEFFGILGSLVAGWISDKHFRGRSMSVGTVYAIFLMFAVLLIPGVPVGHPLLISLSLGVVGFLIYGPIMLILIGTAEVAGKTAAASACGFVGLWGYIGSIVSGAGTGWIIDQYGWNGAFSFLAVCSAFCAVFLYLSSKQVKPVSRPA